MDEPPDGSRSIFCPHCDEEVPKSTFYRHRDKYFDPLSSEWLTGNADHVHEEAGTLAFSVYLVYTQLAF